MSNLEKYKKNPSLLWDDFRGGNEKAFSALFNIYSDPLFRYGMKFMSDEGLVKDCIQVIVYKVV